MEKIIKRTKANLGLEAKRNGKIRKIASNPGVLELAGDSIESSPEITPPVTPTVFPVAPPVAPLATQGQFLAISGIIVPQLTERAGRPVQLEEA